MVELADETANYTVARVTRRVPDTLAGLRLDKALARMFPEHSRNRLQRWLKEGARQPRFARRQAQTEDLGR